LAALPELLHHRAWRRRHSILQKTDRPLHSLPDPTPAEACRTSERNAQQKTPNPHTLLKEREGPSAHDLPAGDQISDETRTEPGRLISDATLPPASQQRHQEPIYTPASPRSSPPPHEARTAIGGEEERRGRRRKKRSLSSLPGRLSRTVAGGFEREQRSFPACMLLEKTITSVSIVCEGVRLRWVGPKGESRGGLGPRRWRRGRKEGSWARKEERPRGLQPI
jgi:hypothetical protein